MAPAKISREILQRLSVAVAEAAKHLELRDIYIKGGNDPTTSTPDEFAARIRADMTKWETLIRAAGVKEE